MLNIMLVGRNSEMAPEQQSFYNFTTQRSMMKSECKLPEVDKKVRPAFFWNTRGATFMPVHREFFRNEVLH